MFYYRLLNGHQVTVEGVTYKAIYGHIQPGDQFVTISHEPRIFTAKTVKNQHIETEERIADTDISYLFSCNRSVHIVPVE